MLNKTVSPAIASLLVALAFLGASVYELNALEAKDRRDHPVGEQTRQFCLSCHSGPEWLAKIAEKEGKKPTDPLFSNDSLAGLAGNKAASNCPAASTFSASSTTYNGK